jgi:PPK2 family polyphosphate:nucleotide phosphotransferase
MKQHRVKPGSKINLLKWDPNDTSGFKGDKAKAELELPRLNDKLEALQELLYAESKHRVLVVLQGMDTSGKGGTIKHVFEGVNPSGVRVASFKAPTAEELSRDFLWRVHKHVPGNGELVIFDRSHYEDVLIVRVHDLVDDSIWKKRYDQINDFERLLAESGTTIVKFFLHIDKDEQKERLEARLQDSEKNWKFRSGDIAERKLWDKYQRAYETILEKTSTEHAPWYVVPANKKWYRNVMISKVLIDTLESLDMKFPAAEEGIEKLEIE